MLERLKAWIRNFFFSQPPVRDSRPESPRAFPTGRDPRWPSKRQQNGWK